MDKFKATRPLTINSADGEPVEVEVGKIVYTNGQGTLSVCEESEVASIEPVVDAQIAENLAKAEAERAETEETAQENPDPMI